MEEAQSQSVPLRAFVDRIEGDLAVIVLSDGSGLTFDLPLKVLPPGVGGGDHLLINIQRDQMSRQKARQTIAELQRELTTDNDAQQRDFKL